MEQMRNEAQKLYKLAVAWDEQFTAELARVYGEKNAGNARYRPDSEYQDGQLLQVKHERDRHVKAWSDYMERRREHGAALLSH